MAETTKTEVKVHQYRVLERSDDLHTPDGIEGAIGGGAGGGGAGGGASLVGGGGTGGSSLPPPRTKYKNVPGYIDHGVVTASSAHQARVAIFETLGRDKQTLIVVREENLLEDTLLKEPRFDIVSVSGRRRAESRRANDGEGSDKEDEPPA